MLRYDTVCYCSRGMVLMQYGMWCSHSHSTPTPPASPQGLLDKVGRALGNQSDNLHASCVAMCAYYTKLAELLEAHEKNDKALDESSLHVSAGLPCCRRAAVPSCFSAAAVRLSCALLLSCSRTFTLNVLSHSPTSA
jgi:hypothetical protein